MDSSNNPLNKLLTKLSLESASENEFIGGSGIGGVTVENRLFGGLLVSQAFIAAAKTSELSSFGNFSCHPCGHALPVNPGKCGVFTHQYVLARILAKIRACAFSCVFVLGPDTHLKRAAAYIG